ncbi:15667_t:CDS:2, partial [Gigaspora margarita]
NFNDGKRIPSTDWESDYNREAMILNAVTPLLNSNNFPKALNIHYNYNTTKPGQDIFGADWVATSNPPRSEQAKLTTLRFLPTCNIAQREEESFIMTYNQQKENAGYTQEYNQ